MNINQTILKHGLAPDLEIATLAALMVKQRHDLNLRAKKYCMIWAV